MPGATERTQMRAVIGEYACRSGYSYKSGAVGLEEYALNMGSARVVINWPRTPINRPHRVLDALACKAALVTGTIPWVDGDMLEPGVHYLSAENWMDFPALIDRLLAGEWEDIACMGYDLVSRQHTWAVRARELREILARELGL
jgi:spore maturation protein CgeB